MEETIKLYSMIYDDKKYGDNGYGKYLGEFKRLKQIREDAWVDDFIGLNIETNETCIILSREVCGYASGMAYEFIPIPELAFKEETPKTSIKDSNLPTSMTREELLERVKNITVPIKYSLDQKQCPELYSKYGIFVDGIALSFRWFTEENITEYAREKGYRPLTEASDIELLMMWAFADNYWLKFYEQAYNNLKEKINKLMETE